MISSKTCDVSYKSLSKIVKRKAPSFWITAQLKSLASYEILPYLCRRNQELQMSVQESPEPWRTQNLREAGRTTETVSGRSE